MTAEEYIMTILQSLNCSISQPAIVIMLETGICTEEAPFDEYLIAKNIIEALGTKEEKQSAILTRTVSEKHRNALLSLWNQTPHLREDITDVVYYQNCIDHWLYRR